MAKGAARPKPEPKATRPARARGPKHGTYGGMHPDAAPNEDDIRVRASRLSSSVAPATAPISTTGWPPKKS